MAALNRTDRLVETGQEFRGLTGSMRKLTTMMRRDTLFGQMEPDAPGQRHGRSWRSPKRGGPPIPGKSRNQGARRYLMKNPG